MTSSKDIALELSYAIMRGDWPRVDALIADDFSYQVDGKPPMGKAAYLGFMNNVLCTAMSDMDMHFPRVVAEGDLVAVEYTNTMTHSGPFLGLPATGKRVTTTGHFMRQIRNGQVCAEWQTTNAMGLMQAPGAQA